jgi:hypothetical protein
MSFASRQILCNISTLLICSLQPYANIGNLRFNTPKHLSTTLRVRIWLSLYSCSAGVLGRSSGVNKKLVLAYPLSPISYNETNCQFAAFLSKSRTSLRNLTLTIQICDISESFVSAIKFENNSSYLPPLFMPLLQQ